MIFLFSVLLGNKSQKQRSQLDEKSSSKVDKMLECLEKFSVPARLYDVKKIKGEKNIYRIRLSSLRIIYAVFWDERIIRVAKIQKRKGNTYCD